MEMDVHCLQNTGEANELGVTQFGVSRTSALLSEDDNAFW
jgi:hypothetical protein